MKKKLFSPSVLNNGPLTGVEQRLEDFSFNLYFSYIFTDTVKTHQQLQDDYVEAFLNQDYEQMEKIDTKMAVVESAFEATACMLDATTDNYS